MKHLSLCFCTVLTVLIPSIAGQDCPTQPLYDFSEVTSNASRWSYASDHFCKTVAKQGSNKSDFNGFLLTEAVALGWDQASESSQSFYQNLCITKTSEERSVNQFAAKSQTLNPAMVELIKQCNDRGGFHVALKLHGEVGQNVTILLRNGTANQEQYRLITAPSGELQCPSQRMTAKLAGGGSLQILCTRKAHGSVYKDTQLIVTLASQNAVIYDSPTDLHAIQPPLFPVTMVISAATLAGGRQTDTSPIVVNNYGGASKTEATWKFGNLRGGIRYRFFAKFANCDNGNGQNARRMWIEWNGRKQSQLAFNQLTGREGATQAAAEACWANTVEVDQGVEFVAVPGENVLRLYSDNEDKDGRSAGAGWAGFPAIESVTLRPVSR